jgi:hypothetical protein
MNSQRAVTAVLSAAGIALALPVYPQSVGSTGGTPGGQLKGGNPKPAEPTPSPSPPVGPPGGTAGRSGHEGSRSGTSSGASGASSTSGSIPASGSNSTSGGARAYKMCNVGRLEAAFAKHDTKKEGKLDKKQLAQLLSDLCD